MSGLNWFGGMLTTYTGVLSPGKTEGVQRFHGLTLEQAQAKVNAMAKDEPDIAGMYEPYTLCMRPTP